MPQKNLEQIVQSMIDANESEDDIASVIKEYNKPKPTVASNEPDTWWGGFKKSITGGEALGAGMEGLKGYAKGAILDLPSSIAGGLGMLGRAVYQPSTEIFDNLKALPGHIADTYSKAGSEPENFGRMMGQLTGQPIATEGLLAGASAAKPYIPKAIAAAGPAVEATGRYAKDNGLFTGALPRMAVPRHLQNLEKFAGRGLEKLGERMKVRSAQGEIVPDALPPIQPVQDGQIIPETQGALPPSNTSFYSGDGTIPPTPTSPISMDDLGVPMRPKMQGMLPPSPVSHYLPESNPVNEMMQSPVNELDSIINSPEFQQPIRVNPAEMGDINSQLNTPIQSPTPYLDANELYRNQTLQKAGYRPEDIAQLTPEQSDALYQHALGWNEDIIPNEMGTGEAFNPNNIQDRFILDTARMNKEAAQRTSMGTGDVVNDTSTSISDWNRTQLNIRMGDWMRKQFGPKTKLADLTPEQEAMFDAERSRLFNERDSPDTGELPDIDVHKPTPNPRITNPTIADQPNAQGGAKPTVSKSSAVSPLDTLKVGEAVIIPRKSLTPERISEFINKGFQMSGVKPDGRVRFKKIK